MKELTRTPETVGAEIRGLTAQAKQMTLWFGIEIGRRLCEVKEMIGHGEWLPYLKAQTEFSQSTASRFMTLYREYGAQQQTLFGAESNYPTLNNLSISNALRLLALPESERESFAEEHDVEHMSARELDELIQAKKAAEDERDLYEQKLAEQMGAAERLKKDAETAAQEAEARRRELAETQAQIRALQENVRRWRAGRSRWPCRWTRALWPRRARKKRRLRRKSSSGWERSCRKRKRRASRRRRRQRRRKQSWKPPRPTWQRSATD